MAEQPGVPVRTGWDRVPDALFVGGAVLSSKSLWDFATLDAHFSPWIAWLFPAIVDGFAIYAAREASDASAEGRIRRRNWAWFLVLAFTGASGALQAADAAVHSTLAMIAHAVPPLVVFLAFEMRQGRAARFRIPAVAAVGAGPTMEELTDGEFAASLRAEVERQVAATMRAEVAAGFREMVGAELSGIRAEIEQAVQALPIQTAPPMPELAAPSHPAPAVGAPNLAAARPPTESPTGTPTQARPRPSRRGGRDGQQGTSAAEIRARLEAAYATAPPRTWSKRSLGKAARCGETAALKFLQEQRDRASSAEASTMAAVGAPGGQG